MMKSAYLDTSFLAAILFEEAGYKKWAKVLASHDRIFSNTLLEAELRSAVAREKAYDLDIDESLRFITWFTDSMPLSAELKTLFSAQYLRGADAFHLATALRIAGSRPHDLGFLTLDEAQRKIAGRLGFRTTLA